MCMDQDKMQRLLGVLMKGEADCEANGKQEGSNPEEHSENGSALKSEPWAASGAGSAVKIPFVGGDRDPPAFDLAELRVGDLDLQREPGDPDRHLQLGGEMLVSEVNNGVHFALHFLAINEDGVAAVRNL